MIKEKAMEIICNHIPKFNAFQIKIIALIAMLSLYYTGLYDRTSLLFLFRASNWISANIL